MMQKPFFFAETPTVIELTRDAPAVRRDPLSDVLELIRVRGNTVFAYKALPPFGVFFPTGSPRLHIVRQGNMVVRLDGSGECFHASQGDLVMLMHGDAHIVSDEPGRSACIPFHHVRCDYGDDRMTPGGNEAAWLCGDFGFDGILAQQLLSVLPPVIMLKGLRDRPFEWLELSCRFILDEALHPRAGTSAMISRLLDVIFVQLLRTWASGGEVGHGWLSGAIDERISQAISAMHADPSRGWTVQDLATLSNLSRSAFADRFQRVVGQAPLAYLSAWRLDRAAELLRHGRSPVSEICYRVGYTSEAAFSRAFKNRYGRPPLQWRRFDPGKCNVASPGNG